MTDTLDRGVRLGGEAGLIRRIEGGWELRFERRLRHSPERVWKALTTGDGLACWLAEAEIDLRPGGRMDLNFNRRVMGTGLEQYHAAIPAHVPAFFVRTLTDPNDLVFDPFAGTNSTGYAAESAGRKWLSLEPAAHMIRLAKLRLP